VGLLARQKAYPGSLFRCYSLPVMWVARRAAGHASPLTTVRYDRRGDEARREAVEHLHFPYTRRGKP